MVRPGRGPIELTDGDVSRRRLLRLATAGAGAALAGCGGGGDGSGGVGDRVPTVTWDGGTVADAVIKDVTGENLEKFTPNPWHPQTGFLPSWQRLDLATLPRTSQAGPGEDPASLVLPGAAERVVLDPGGTVTFHLRDDLTWSDGSAFDAENVRMYWTIRRALAGAGDEPGAPLPSASVVDATTVRATLPDGPPALRLYESVFRAGMTDVSSTHPAFHREYVEAIRDATTEGETAAAIRELVGATFPRERLTGMALGPFAAADVASVGIAFGARAEFPWGLGHRDVSRIFRGVEMGVVAIGSQAVNAAVSGKRDFITLEREGTFDRFPETWERHTVTEPTGGTLYFSPESPWGARTERARRLRRALASLLDPAPAASITGVVPAAELTAGFFRTADFEAWIGDAFEDFTNYGTRANGYAKPEMGFELLREAGFERGAEGTWVDAGSGEPLAPSLSTRTTTAVSRFVIDRLVQELREHGIDVRTEGSGEPDLLFLLGQADTYPHPYFGFRNDCGLGSVDLGPEIGASNWRNGYGRVEVPMPVGDPDGDLETYDWDARVRELGGMTDGAAIRERVRELSWVLNQWVPGVLLFARTYHAALNASRLVPTRGWTADRWPRSGLSVADLLALGSLEPPA